MPHFPMTPLLDSFVRPNEGTLSGAGLWDGAISNDNILALTANQVQSTAGIGSRRYSSQRGPDCEAWATLAVKPANGTSVTVALRALQTGTSNWDGYECCLTAAAGTDSYTLRRIDNAVVGATPITVAREFSAGDGMGLRAYGSTLELWHAPVATGLWERVGSAQDATYNSAGYMGLRIENTVARFTNFGGGNFDGIGLALGGRSGWPRRRL